jgi:hypothetical protein
VAVRVHHDQSVLLGVLLEDPDLRLGAVLVLDVVEYEVVRRAVELFGSVLDSHVAERIRVDPTTVPIRRLENDHVVPEAVERVRRIEPRGAGSDDHDSVVRRGLDGPR